MRSVSQRLLISVTVLLLLFFGVMAEVLDARSREAAAPTFAADGLYFVGPRYEDHWGLPAGATTSLPV